MVLRRNALTKAEIEDFDIWVPSISEQKAIASILSSLDSKIDLLRRQNLTLENIAQTLFKRWFIDFEFPDKNGTLTNPAVVRWLMARWVRYRKGGK